MKYSLKKMVRKPLIVLEIVVFLLCLGQITLNIFAGSGELLTGLIYALPFSVVTVFMVRYIYLTMIIPCCSLKDEYEITFDKLTQYRKGEKVKEISLGSGVNVYSYRGIIRTSLVFSRRKLPQGEILRTYKNDPEVIYIPYMAKKMPKLKKYMDKSTRI